MIISHVIANGGCPCPGIGDTALSVSDTVLHFFYNAVAYAGILAVYVHVVRRRGHLLPDPPWPRRMTRRQAASRGDA